MGAKHKWREKTLENIELHTRFTMITHITIKINDPYLESEGISEAGIWGNLSIAIRRSQWKICFTDRYTINVVLPTNKIQIR